MKGLEINNYLLLKGLKQADFADAIKKKQSQVSRWISQNTELRNAQSKQILDLFPDFYDPELSDYKTNILEEPIAEYHKSKHINVVEANNIEEFMKKDLPPIGRIDVADFIEATYGVVMKGDTLGGDIKGGDVLAYKEWFPRNYFEYGKIYIVCTRDHLFVRYLKKHEDKDMVLLKSKNDFYDDIDLPINEIKSLYVVNGAIVHG
jgi:transcriptional regulator with XRE-family HTH domain